MMDYKKSISLMKKPTFSEAFNQSVDVFDSRKNSIGRLVPVGSWILDDKEKIESIRAWRQSAMRMFLTQFESTSERTFAYLKDLSIAQEGRIFFLIYDSDNRFIGHIGVADVDGKTGELDNLMRGVEGGDPRLVYFAEIALLDWSFKNLGITESHVRVLSYNWLVIALHREVGYVHTEKLPLKKIIDVDVTVHDVVVESQSNVKYACVKMSLDKDQFYQTNSWLCLKI
jgi:hypothetical protein